jgi:hypothetical protein
VCSLQPSKVMSAKRFLVAMAVGGDLLIAVNSVFGQTAARTNVSGTNAFVLNQNTNSSNLSTNVAENQEVQLENEAKQMRKNGLTELNMRDIANYQQNVAQRSGWMDVEFVKIDDTPVRLYLNDLHSEFLSFQVKDKNGDYYGDCVVDRKTPVFSKLTKLKRGDKVRLIGSVAYKGYCGGYCNGIPWFQVDSIEMIKSAAK